MMSTQEEMGLYAGEQTRRNKDYITITRDEYSALKEYREEVLNGRSKNKQHSVRLCEYEEKLKDTEKKLKLSRYSISLMARNFSKEIIGKADELHIPELKELNDEQGHRI